MGRISLHLIGNLNFERFNFSRHLVVKLMTVLSGKIQNLLVDLSDEMQIYSQAGRFEKAATVRDIIEALAAQDIVVEKRMILLKEPLKTVGSFRVPIRVYNEVEPEITVEISPE